jgi:anti-anti-sigma factor
VTADPFSPSLDLSGDVLVVVPQGRMGKEEADGLCALVMPRLQEQARSLLLDLTAVDYMTSAALGVIISLLQKVRSRGGRMAVSAPGERVHLLLEVAGLNQLVDLCRSRAEAEQLLMPEEPGA